MNRELERRVREIVISILGDEYDLSDMNSDEKLEKFGLDSISLVKVVVNIETEFGFEFDDESLMSERITNIRGLVEYIESKI